MSSQPERGVGGTAAGALLGISALHAIWLFSPWPLSTWSEWSRAFGNETFRVSAPVMGTVAGLFGLAAYVVAAQSGVVRAIGPAWIYRVATGVIAILFILRATIGFVQMSRMLDHPAMTEVFRRTTWLYLLLYLPIFLAVGVMAGYVALVSPVTDRRSRW